MVQEGALQTGVFDFAEGAEKGEIGNKIEKHLNLRYISLGLRKGFKGKL